MSDLTLDQKTDYASNRAIQLEAEKHFFAENADFRPLGFSVGYRNPGHWDIYAEQRPGKASAWNHANPNGFTTAQDGGRERAFCIRGEPGDVYLRDERWDPNRPFPREPMKFRSVMGAMVYIMEELMQEPVA